VEEDLVILLQRLALKECFHGPLLVQDGQPGVDALKVEITQRVANVVIREFVVPWLSFRNRLELV
jgi:hypothetical protein